jgi:hypothetical protein
MMDGTGKSKPGYDKILFYEEQGRRDGLQYFRVGKCLGKFAFAPQYILTCKEVPNKGSFYTNAA